MNNSEFNDVSGLGRYRHLSKKQQALDDLKVGIQGRVDLGYPDKTIADEICSRNPEHPILKDISGRDISHFRKKSGGSTGRSKSKGGKNS